MKVQSFLSYSLSLLPYPSKFIPSCSLSIA